MAFLQVTNFFSLVSFHWYLGVGGGVILFILHIGHQKSLEISELTKGKLSTGDHTPEVPSLNFHS